MWKIVLFWSKNRKTRFLHTNLASRKLRLLILIKRNVYQTQPDALPKALFAKNLIFLFEKRVFSQNVRKFVLCLKSTFCGEIVFCVEIQFLSKILNKFVLKISASIKHRLADLLKQKIYQIQLGGLLKALFTENITLFWLEIKLLV